MTTTTSANQIKKRPVAAQSSRSRPLAILTLTGSGRNVYKVQERAASHDEMMQRFQLRRVSSDKIVPSNFGRGKHLIIDKATGSKHRKSPRFSMQRFLRSLVGAKARAQLATRLMSPITPKSWASTTHGLVMLLMHHFQLLYLPFSSSYMLHDYHRSAATFAVLETVFLVDLLLNLNTAYIDQGALVLSRAKIARNYLRRWFIFDLFSALPLQIGYCILMNSSHSHPTLQVIQLTLMALRVLRTKFLEKGVLLSRVMRVANHVAEWVRYSRYSHLLGIAQLMWFVLLIAHYMACVWHLVANTQSPQDQTVGEQYMADYYYAVSLIQGQGNAVGTWNENFYSSVSIIVGSVILAIVFGNVAMLVSNFNANETNYHRKMEAVYATMDKMDLPLGLRKRVNEYYTHVWHEYEVLDGSINKFEKELTHTLRIEIGLYKFMNLVVKVPFWQNCTPDFLTQIVLNLSMRVYMPDDYVVRRREIGSEMMMINLGYCKLSKPMRLQVNVNADSPGTATPLLASHEIISNSGLEADEDSDDEWSDSSSDGSDDEPGSLVLGSQRLVRRMSGSVFELKGTEAESSTPDTKPEPSNQRRFSNPRRHSNPSSVPSSVEIERPKQFRAYLSPGQAFGEMSLLMNYERQANIRAVTFVEMCVLDRSTFQKIISRYPEDRRRVLTKMLESCIEKKEIPFPWENIIEAVTIKRRNSLSKDISRASVIATMTADEAARILVEAIDVNVPDDTIKYGFQNFDQQFVDEPSLRQANSVEAKIRDTLQRSNSGVKEVLQHKNSGLRDTFQRTNSGISSYRVYSRRSSRIDTNRSTSTADLTEPESDMQDGTPSNNGTSEKTLETMMQLMHTMVESIGRLQGDINELKARAFCCNKCGGATGDAGSSPTSLSDPLVSSSRVATYLKPIVESARDSVSLVTSYSSNPLHEVDGMANIKEKPADENEDEVPTNMFEEILSADADFAVGKLPQNAESTRSTRAEVDSSGCSSQYSLKHGNSGRKTPPADLPALSTAESPLVELERYADGRSSRFSSRSRTERHPTFTDFLWKRSNTSGDLRKQLPIQSKARWPLKTRRSLPAGAPIAVGAVASSEMAPIPDDHEVIVDNGDPQSADNGRVAD